MRQEFAILRSTLKSQYHAALAMLRQAIDRCPDDIWIAVGDSTPFWRVAYHTLYYTDLYLQPDERSFRPWDHHQTRIQHMDDIPGPPELEEFTELADRPPQTGNPYTKPELLAYWTTCDGMIDAAVDALDVLRADSGFSWKPRSKVELQVENIRHIQHHTAQLIARLRSEANIGVEWVGGGVRSSAGSRISDC
jgi:hypothetical protein